MNLFWNLRFKLITIKLFGVNRNRHGGDVACYIRNYLSCSIISVFSREIESVFFEIVLPNSKPITVGTIYRPPNQSNFLEVLNKKMNKIDSISNEIYILGDILTINSFFVQEKFLGLKEARTNILNSARSSIARLIFSRKL